MVNREELIKKAGSMVVVHYKCAENKKCFSIGWFFELNEEFVRLKITSTRFETFESTEIKVDDITKIEEYERD